MTSERRLKAAFASKRQGSALLARSTDVAHRDGVALLGRGPRPRSNRPNSRLKLSREAAEVLRAHRASLRALFACLERAWRMEEVAPRDRVDFQTGWFVEDNEGSTLRSASPLGWTLASGRSMSADWLYARAARWTWSLFPIDGIVNGHKEVHFDAFERMVAWWAGDKLELMLGEVAEACCDALRQSCLASLELRAPWWLLGRGEPSTSGTTGPSLAEIQSISHCAFSYLGDGWTIADAYALCRDAGLLGEALSPAALLTAFERSRPRDQRSFDALVGRLAALWWRGEGGAGSEGESAYDPVERLMVERVLPLLASRRQVNARSSRFDLDEESLGVVREHDMALRCLFVAYCSSEDADGNNEARVASLSLLHFARDFRLLAAERFSPNAIVDAARASHHPNHPLSAAGAPGKGLRWPEFVETLLRLARSLGDRAAPPAPLTDALASLLSLMDPDGRVFFLGEHHRIVVDPPRVRLQKAVRPSAPSRRRCTDTRRAARASLEAAANATRRLAAKTPNAGVDAIAEAVEAAARSADRDVDAASSKATKQTASTTTTATQVDLLFDGPAFEWPPPPRSSPDDIWAQGEEEVPSPPEFGAAPFIFSRGALRRGAATLVQKTYRGFSLRRRLAMLRDRLLFRHDADASAFVGDAMDAFKVAAQTTDNIPVNAPPAEAASPQMSTRDDERAVIHAFALAALLGDGSPRRVARARALVETLKDLPEMARDHPFLPAPELGSPYRRGRPEHAQPTLDELEASLREALARVALEDKWQLANEGDASEAKDTAARLSAAIEAHPGFAAREAARDATWELREAAANQAALDALRELVPRDVASSDKPAIAAKLAASVGVDADQPGLAELVDRIWTVRALWLVHVPREQIAKIHVADLRGRYTFADLDQVELRAVYRALPTDFDNDDDGAKHAWRAGLKRKLVELVASNPRADEFQSGAQLLAASAAGHSAYDVLDAAKRKSKEQIMRRLESSSSNASSIIRQKFNDGPLWRECWDENYNRHYFFNDLTGESRWEEPDTEYIPLQDDEDDVSNAPSEPSIPPLDPPDQVRSSMTDLLDPVVEEAGSISASTSSPRPQTLASSSNGVEDKDAAQGTSPKLAAFLSSVELKPQDKNEHHEFPNNILNEIGDRKS